MKYTLDKIGNTGTLTAITLSSTSCCLPFFASISSALGLTFLLPYASYFIYSMQAFVLLSLVGSFFSFRKHNNPLPFILAIASGCAIIATYNFLFAAWLLYSGLIGLIASMAWNSLELKRCNTCQPIDNLSHSNTH